MIVILEGNEANFKTTVADKLSKHLGLPVVKGSSFELAKCSNEELFEHFKGLGEMDNIILDRFIYSNQNYATLYKDYAILTDEQRTEIESMVKQKATVYYLHAGEEVIKSRINKRGDDYVDVSMVGAINMLYKEIMINSKLKVVFYNTEHWSSDEIVESIIN